MPTVFVSHSVEDAQFIEREIIPLLKSKGIDVWYSPQAIATSEEWERAIKRGLESSDWFLVALSPRSVKSKWVRAETGWAFANRDGKIIPILVEACDPFDLHIRLNDLQFADFRRDPKKGTDQLLKAFERRPEATDGSSEARASGPSDEEPAVDVSPLKGLAHAMMLKGDFDGAIEELNGALEVSPRDAGAFVLRGACRINKGELSGAIVDFTRAIEGDLNPLARSLTLVHRARAHVSQNDDRKATADCTEALRSDPNNADAYLLRGMIKRRSFQREPALADFAEAIKLRPTSSEAFLQRAEVLRDAGETAKAKADYAEAVRLDPSAAARVPAHMRAAAPSSTSDRLEDALRSLRALGLVTQMDQSSPAFKAKFLNVLMSIGIPKMMADLDYLIEHLPKDSNEYKAASVLNDVARNAGLKK